MTLASPWLKNDYASSYTFNPSRPHVLTSVNKYSGGNTNFSFDDNGNMTQGDGESISYNEFNKPILIESGASESTFTYGADSSRRNVRLAGEIPIKGRKCHMDRGKSSPHARPLEIAHLSLLGCISAQ